MSNYHYFVQAKVVNQKAGIYFALSGKIQNITHSLGGLAGIDVYPGDRYAWRFKPMCWNERNQPYTISTNAPDKRYAWKSTRSLSKYEISFQYDIYFNGTYDGSTSVLYMKDGY